MRRCENKFFNKFVTKIDFTVNNQRLFFEIQDFEAAIVIVQRNHDRRKNNTVCNIYALSKNSGTPLK